MSILIKGTKMPPNCGYCPCGHYDCMALTDYDKNIEVDISGYFHGDKRHPDCPLIEVKPHGRLIDADALLMRINHEDMEAYMDGVCYGVHPSMEYLDLLSEIIADAPTVIEAEGET